MVVLVTVVEVVVVVVTDCCWEQLTSKAITLREDSNINSFFITPTSMTIISLLRGDAN
jgi:hypothetical protein